ncbi:uncharacterized protein LOC114199686 [Eumetopias jubatus]|uniref:uncharacterized protein LOC114199686 n=1 Tax=Eumetopias jubatus TaxID=34886 RepID=UPI00101612A8|nr:uncharacterized protein LOC114199686 [Eumetopias jubatus]
MRAAPRQPRGPGLLRLRGGSPLAGPGEGALQLGLLSQLKFSFQLRPALHSRAPGRALRRPHAASCLAPLPARRPRALPAASFRPGPARLLPWAALPGSPSALVPALFRACSRYSAPGASSSEGTGARAS